MNPEGRQTSNVPEAMDTVVPTTQQLTPTTPPPGVTPRPSRPPTRRFMTMTSRAISVRYVGPRRSLQSTRPYRAAACPSVPNQPRALPPPMRFGMPPRGQAWLPGLGHRIPVKTMAVTSATPLYKDTRPKLRSTHAAGAGSFIRFRGGMNKPPPGFTLVSAHRRAEAAEAERQRILADDTGSSADSNNSTAGSSCSHSGSSSGSSSDTTAESDSSPDSEPDSNTDKSEPEASPPRKRRRRYYNGVYASTESSGPDDMTPQIRTPRAPRTSPTRPIRGVWQQGSTALAPVPGLSNTELDRRTLQEMQARFTAAHTGARHQVDSLRADIARANLALAQDDLMPATAMLMDSGPPACTASTSTTSDRPGTTVDETALRALLRDTVPRPDLPEGSPLGRARL